MSKVRPFHMIDGLRNGFFGKNWLLLVIRSGQSLLDDVQTCSTQREKVGRTFVDSLSWLGSTRLLPCTGCIYGRPKPSTVGVLELSSRQSWG